MSAQEIVAAAVVAGVFMYIISELGFRLGLFKSNLALIDGEFAIRYVRMPRKQLIGYIFGMPIHLVTSAVFGLVYYGIVRVFDLNTDSANVIAPYVFVLYIAMLLGALPVAGQGIMGSKIGRLVWAEQLIFHAVFGLGLWWALRMF